MDGGGVGGSQVGVAEPSVSNIDWGWSLWAPIVRGLFHKGWVACNLWAHLPTCLLLLWPGPWVWCTDWWYACTCGIPWPVFKWLWCPSSIYYPWALMLKLCAKDKAFAAMFGKGVSTLWLVVDKVFHSDGEKVSGVIVVWAVHVGIGGIFGVWFGLA